MRDSRFRIDHTALEVHDMDRAVRFYKELLQMDVVAEMTVDEGTPYHHHGVQLGYGGKGSTTLLELVEFFKDPPGDLRRAPRHIAIDVPDLDKIVSGIRNYGGEVEVARMTVDEENMAQAIVFDSEGNCLTLRQFL